MDILLVLKRFEA